MSPDGGAKRFEPFRSAFGRASGSNVPLCGCIATCHLSDDRRNPAAAEDALQAALADARARRENVGTPSRQGSRRPLVRPSKPEEARDLLAPVYGCFTEGVDAPDVRDAKALLDELRGDSLEL